MLEADSSKCNQNQMNQQSAPLPEFDKPPVSEVVLSVEFKPLAGWRSPHAGLYWSRINKEYPHTEARPPLASQIERFGEAFWERPSFSVQMLDSDLSRFWFLAEPPTSLIQIQRDRFIVNWRKVQGDEVYPRYENEVRPRFIREWARFKLFVKELNLGDLDIQQCEVTYVNDIIQGEGWNKFPESLTLFHQWSGQSDGGFLPPLETLSMTGSFLMPDERGRLHFAAQHVMRQLDKREAVQLRLTARGRPESSADADVLNWLDMAREWIVRGFTDLTSPKAHQLWKRTR